MDIRNIVDELLNNKNPSSSYIMTETLILKVLAKFCEDNNKELITNYIHKNVAQKGVHEFDAFAPNGFNDYLGATVFEIKAYRNKNSLRNLNEMYYKLLKMIKSSGMNVKNLIFIVTLELTDEEKLNIITKFENQNEINIDLWDLKNLQAMFDKYPAVVSKTIENISELVLNNQVFEGINNEPYYSDSQRDKHIDNLRKCFFDDELVLFLGAGVSRDAKIPMWDNLVSDLLVSLLSNKLKEFNINLSENERDYIIEKLKDSNGNSPLLMARYIRQGLQDIFTETLTQILYKTCVNESKLLTAITKLCKPVRNGVGIRGVVNYNFDDLIEYNFVNHDISHRAIFREGDIPTRDELGVYHVHGFLPRDGKSYTNLAKSLLVFSEEGYHSLMLDPYSWSNLIQLNYLRENTSLFIGLSLTDPNLRRLLDIASRKQESDICKHYAILRRELYHKKELDEANVNLRNIQKFDTVNQKLQEEYYKELGLNVIWVDDYNEIPSILDKIRI
ncbi:SIR2 family protein [Brevibacillus laterosporus]|uniref:SIR2 family protein n=1 Tax=Brevibacillus laterosporus TaxID=1465 RepID=A0AAP3DLY9_BRELA|nr:SIR2 family protein [Brevibacillus laterosporus]MCR8982976.1 SIR2 family protein [Brevibacillus laterosporus]MCZ0810132.1 SIR2 family protein [Brevibacillus laterosporus]MCZ0828758.1 SIR2 family protein [Brevibacillus laterosporus]MCZ0852772.1 SIR2 family protein [Brevibacillus laterosporus]